MRILMIGGTGPSGIPIVERLVGWLRPVVAAIDAAPPPRDDFLRGRFDADGQWEFTLELLSALGFDLASCGSCKSVLSAAAQSGDARSMAKLRMLEHTGDGDAIPGR